MSQGEPIMSGHYSMTGKHDRLVAAEDGPTEIELHNEVEANLARAKGILEQLQQADRQHIIDLDKEARLRHLLLAARHVLDKIADNDLHTKHLYQASFQEYFITLSQAEELINNADQQAEDEEKAEIVVDQSGADEVVCGQLTVLNSEQRIELPMWAIDFTARFINDRLIRELAVEDERLDELYLVAVGERTGFERRLSFEGLTEAMLLQVAVEHDKAEQEKAIQQIRESFILLRNDWAARFEPVAKKYQLIIDNLPNITRLITAYLREHRKKAK